MIRRIPIFQEVSSKTAQFSAGYPVLELNVWVQFLYMIGCKARDILANKYLELKNVLPNRYFYAVFLTQLMNMDSSNKSSFRCVI